ncbi:hypothetical protein J8C06_14480 [Chloracidobacterium validum]|uniref:Glycosyltransferase RgtA/B/C/D-like domain-containing protein n=1 Tax=Chloracidobacterium validum TaxID=2821543 RepID=A0ABX8BF44_9BACT|nr:hypothetical protein [Chloracidobacterium validum]QUW04243.1 hypothetical protein J8C06_14480 [Chloracidobacterium validum]
MAEQKQRGLVAGFLFLAGLVTLVVGWRAFWFLTDDAYIAFRYVSNWRLGHGLVWNPAPFRPVEGYTSLLWVVVLTAVWKVTGYDPPAAANYLTLGFAALTLVLTGLVVWHMPFSARLAPGRWVLLAAVFIGMLSNRTFLAWTSSGLETAMFNALLLAWMLAWVWLPRHTAARLAVTATLAALVYLTRPDGLLFAMASGALFAADAWFRKRTWRVVDWLAVAPLLVIPAHLLWRKSFYGEWLPNTHYAKSDPRWLWVTSGARYALSFVIEYALWFWLALALAVLWVGVRRWRQTWAWLRQDAARLEAAVGLLVIGVSVGAQVAYYTFVIGGDHFEYRVYSQLIPLIFITAVWMLNALEARLIPAAAFLTLFIGASLVIPWTHWATTKDRMSREETSYMKVAVADVLARRLPLPDVALAYFRWYDRLQFWLIDHAVCMRHQEHKVFHLFLLQVLPARDVGEKLKDDHYPVVTQTSVGVMAWVLPHVNVIDEHGLNDYVVARNTRATGDLMAHFRSPPPGYLECFRPNVAIRDGRATILPRDPPLTAADIRHCEEAFRP